jgi:hypothetical protein
MNSRPSNFAVAGLVASLTAFAGLPGCGGSDANPAQPSCEDRDGLVCNPPGFASVKRAAAVTDYCFVTDASTCPATTIPPAGSTTAHLTQPAAGKLCMAGTAASNGWAILGLRFLDTRNPDGTVVTSFHPVEAGIAAYEVAIDSPPSGGISPSTYGGFHLQLPSGLPVVVTDPGPLMVPLSGFVSDSDPSVTVLPDDVQAVGFDVGPGDYDFCIHDFKFLDAAGNPVTP